MRGPAAGQSAERWWAVAVMDHVHLGGVRRNHGRELSQEQQPQWDETIVEKVHAIFVHIGPTCTCNQ